MVAVFVAKSSSTVFSRAALLNLNQYANNPKNSLQVRHLSFAKNWSRSQKNIVTAIGVITFGAAGGLVWALDSSVNASGLNIHPPKYPWYHKGYMSSFDHASLRRGYEVYKQVCSACHSLRYVAFRNLIGVTHTAEEAAAEAADFQIEDGPDENGDMFMRSGKVTDYFPNPYKNDNAARAANNGSAPPDLTYAILTKRTEEDYIFSILTGYHDPPAGVVVGEGQHYNPYFTGSAISMARALYDDVIEYSDGTPATTSQLAKDVVTFLTWCSQPELETRHRYMIKTLMLWPIAFGFIWYMKRSVWTVLKTRRVLFKPPNYKK